MPGIGRKQRRARTDAGRMSLPTAALLAAVLTGLAGCASVPPPPPGAPIRPAPTGRPGVDPDDNWLYKSVTGQQTQQSAPPSAAAPPATASASTAVAPGYPNPGPAYNPAAASASPPAAAPTYAAAAPGAVAQPVSYTPGTAPPSAVVPAGGRRPSRRSNPSRPRRKRPLSRSRTTIRALIGTACRRTRCGRVS